MRRTILIATLSALVGALVATPIAVYASHSFTDVPNTNTFHEDIAWLADAGVTQGCNPPDNTEFCPDDEVTREQMAAFMRRFAQYLDAEDGTPGLADHATTADSATTADNATQADQATSAEDADTVDGNHASDFYAAGAKVADSELLDGKDAAEFVADGDTAGGDLSGTYPNPTIAFDAVDSETVRDRTLSLTDIAVFDDIIIFDPPNVAANDCVIETISEPAVAFPDVTYVMPSANASPLMVQTLTPESLGQLRFQLCNPTTSAFNAPSGGWRFIAFEQ